MNEQTNALSCKMSLHLDIQGEQAGEYAVKYASKPDRKRPSDGDTLLAAIQHLHPQNAVTTGTFARCYNKVSDTGPKSIFQTIHNNINLPFVSSNFKCSTFSVLGISVVKKANHNADENENQEDTVGVDYALPTQMEKFDHCWDSNVLYGNINPKEFKKQMCLKEFCDKFNSKMIKSSGDKDTRLHLSLRNMTNHDNSCYYPIALKPHLSEKNANPKSPKFWLYCKHLCLWLLPCRTIHDFLPTDGVSQEQLQDHWTIKYYENLGSNLSLLPKWARAYHHKYHNDDDSSSSSSDCYSDHESVINLEDDNEAEESLPNDSSEEDMDPDVLLSLIHI